ncbi:MAG: MBL fold metallo-hydrolase [Halobacteriaceae archaeon]
MDVTVLGSGDALGMPVPLCDCPYCTESDRRRRPALLVEDAGTTVVLDAGPDLPAQLRAADVTAPDAVFLTHHHYDHMAGLWELYHAQLPLSDHVLDPDVYEPGATPPRTRVPVYMTDRAVDHLEAHNDALTDCLADDRLTPGDPVTVGDLTVTPFPVDHARPTFHTQAFHVATEDATLVYAPDLRDWLPDHPAGTRYADPDLLAVEGAGFFRADPHGPGAVLAEAVAAADADHTVLLNVSEHLHRQHTDVLAARAAERGYELGADGATYTL